jgi:uncharacterized protein with GYD domain
MRNAILAATATFLLGQPAQRPQETAPDNRVMLTIFLRHDQSKTLDEIRAHLDKTGFIASFPPQGVEVVSWYVMMGIGQVVTVRFPPEKLREVNRMIEQKAWGAYRTEFYPTYDYKAVAEQERQKRAAQH